MDDIERVIRNITSKMFASRAEREKEGKFVIMTMNRVFKRYSDEGIDSPSLLVFVSSPAAASRNILSRWSWVEKDTIELIANGEFQIDWLPKLHRTDDLRNAYLKKSLKGVYQPLKGGPAEVILGTTKLKSSFNEPTTFFLA